MVDDPLEHGPERKPIMSAERRGKADDRYCVGNGRRLEV